MATLQKIYSDIDYTFTKKPVTGDVALSYDEMAVIRSVRNLLLTKNYERPFNPVIGSNVRRMLFENVDTIIAGQLEKEIKDTIENFEPRASVINVTAIPVSDENGYNIIDNRYN